MEALERLQERLHNLHSVEPILDALRMISLRNWRQARHRQAAVQAYSRRLLGALPALLPHLPAGRQRSAGAVPAEKPPPRRVALVVGSERGLCGRFNAAVVERADAYLAAQAESPGTLEIRVVGTRARRLMGAERSIPEAYPMPALALPPWEAALTLTTAWLGRYEDGEIDEVVCVYNAYRGAGRFTPVVARILPPALPAERPPAETWPPPIVETDPLTLYVQIVRQWTATHFYGLLLESAAAEHAIRYQLMESALQNTERLVDELTLAVHSARRQAITREMQELAVGAGLIGTAEKKGRR